MRERIESKHVTKEIKSQMPVIPVEIVKERGCTFCPYYLGNYEKQPRCMMKIVPGMMKMSVFIQFFVN